MARVIKRRRVSSKGHPKQHLRMARVEEWVFSLSSSSLSVSAQADITGTKSISGDSNTEGKTLATDILVAVLLAECSQAINDRTNICMSPLCCNSKQLPRFGVTHFPIQSSYSQVY